MALENIIIKLDKVVKYYGNAKALDNIDLQVNKGDIFGILGPNGSGKSTTMKIITGLTSFNSGTCYIFNEDITSKKKEIQKRVGLVTQEYSFYDDLKVEENVAFFGRLYGLSGDRLKQNIRNSLELVNLQDYSKKYPNIFSGGMKRRLNIACALVHEPELLIMDEPTASLDPISRSFILKSVKDIRSNGATVIYTSHYLDEIEELCDKAAILNEGKIIVNGTTDDIKIALKSKIVINISLDGVSPKHWNDILNIKNYIYLSEKINIIERNTSLYKTNKSFDYIINCNNATKILEQILPFLKERNIFISSLDIKKNSLEDIFVNIIEKTNKL